jgi:hypothetical protein
VPRKPDISGDIVKAARLRRDRIMSTCDVPRAADMSMEVFAAFREHGEATAADGMFALAMAAAVLAADAPPAERAALAAAIGLMILDCLPLAVERLATPQVLH